MNPSLFIDFVSSFFPQLQTIIDKVNGSKKELTYLHKDTSILRRVYSPDNKYEADTVDVSYMAADYVSMDSSLPVKSRDVLTRATGKLPKVGMKKALKESEITALNIMEAQGGQITEIRRKLAQDAVACSTGIDERNEYAFLSGLSQGYVGLKDDDSTNLLRINYGYLDKNKCGVETTGTLTVDDLKRAIDTADANGDSIITFWIAKSTFDALKQTDSARQLVASYNGQTYDSASILPVPTTAKFQEAFEDETGVTFRIINRSVRIERDGKYTSVKPWNSNYVIGVCSEQIGSLVYGQLAEQTNAAEGATYQLIDSYKLISKFSKTDPLVEFTCGQAFVLPVIEDVDSIYQIDLTLEDQVASDTDDNTEDTVTINGTAYTKSEAIIALNVLGAGLKSDASDDEVIAAYNALSATNKKKFLEGMGGEESSEETSE